MTNTAKPLLNSIRRGYPHSETIYIEGSLQGVNTSFVLDTGAEKTVVSEIIYNQIKNG